jgi:septal ring factor EnvC (AmiA/AmiB activator)
MTKHFNEQLAEKEDQLTALQADVRVRHDQLEQRCNAAIVRADKTQSELTAAYEQIDYKNGTIARLEQTLSADTARLEKKLHAQVSMDSTERTGWAFRATRALADVDANFPLLTSRPYVYFCVSF